MGLDIIVSGGGNAVEEGIVIPQVDLASFGLTVAEVTADDTGIARCIWAILKAVQSFDVSSALGLTKPALPAFSIVAGNYTNRSYSLTVQRYVDYVSGNSGAVPLPTVGANAGNGGFALTDIFPNAVKVATSGPVADASVVIPASDLNNVDNSITQGSIDITSGQDNRNLLSAIYEAIAETTAVRSASVASAFTSLTRGTLGLIPTIPADYISATDPTSGLVRDNALDGQIALLSKTHTLVVQTEDDESNDTTDVRVATS